MTLQYYCNCFDGRSRLVLWLILGWLAFVPSPARAVGTWAALVNASPGLQINNMLLMPDGTVLAHDVNTGDEWFKLTPTTNGSYINGTWSQIASMNYSREYCSSQVLTNGEVFVAGGEYDLGVTNAEYYNPANNTWTMAPNPPGYNKFLDSNSEILPNGNVLVAPVSPSSYGETLIWNAVANTWTVGPTLYRGDDQDEACWVKLADESILTIDPFGTNSERYLPAQNEWVNDGKVPVTMYSNLGEMGAGFLLPNGQVFYLGGTGHTATYTPWTTNAAGIYTPTGATTAGSWTAGPNLPNGYGIQDGPAAMMCNGKILCCAATNASTYDGPSYFYEYSYVSNTFTPTPSPTSATAGASFGPAPFVCCMLDLPDGTVLMSREDSQLYVYQPDASPSLAEGQPVIDSVTPNPDGSFLVTGTLFNGISEGAAYGDDAQMNTDYPLARLTNSAGNVIYARTYNWSSSGVMTGTNIVSTDMVMPTNLPAGTYTLVIVANGNSSAPVQITYPPMLTWDVNSATGGTHPEDGGGYWDFGYWWSGSGDVTWSDAAPVAASFGAGGTAGRVTLLNPQIATSVTFNPLASGTYTLSGAASLTLTNGITANASATVATPVVLGANQTWNVATNHVLTVSGVLSGNGNLTQAGEGGTLVLSGVNTFTNGVTVTSGALWINNSSALGAGTKTIVLDNGTAGQPSLHLNGTNGNLTLPAGISFLTSWVSGTLYNEAGSNIINGNLTLTAGGGDTYIVVNNGTLTLAGNLTPNYSARNLRLGGAGAGTVSGVIADGTTYPLTSLIKQDAGTWTLANASTYSGVTTISAGTLLVTGSLGTNTVAVAAAGALGGIGTVNGAVTLNGMLAPGGNGVGTLTTAGETWNSGGMFQFALNNATNSTGMDGVAIKGALNLQATASNSFTIKLVSLTSSNTPGLLAGFAEGVTNVWTIATASGGINNFNPSVFAVSTTSFSNAINGAFAVTTNGNSLELVYTPASTSLVSPVIGPNVTFNGGSFGLYFSGPSGQSYRVLTSTDLALPLTNWLVLTNGYFGAGMVNFTDATATNVQKFYLVTSP